MFNSIILNIKQEQYRRYSEAFNFFQSKSINMIIGSRKLDYVVHYRDLQFLDDETEYFKRYYGTSQTSTRIKKLINYYEINMTPPIPNLLPIHNYHILETRNRKLLKLCIMKEKELDKRSIVHEDQEESEGHMILSQLNNSNYSAPSSDKSEESENESYDSDPHNTYEVEENAGREKSNPSDARFNLNDHSDFLIMEFKLPEEPPKINIIPPVPAPAPPPDKVTVSIAVQTLPVEIVNPQKKAEKEREQRKEREAREKEKEKQRQREKEKMKQVLMPELRKETSPSPLSEGLGIRSEIKQQNVILTESIKRQGQEVKKKPSTFMDYYNSVPVKNPTNILQKFIKKKK